MNNKMRDNIIKVTLLAALLGYIFYPTFLWMIERWDARDSYYGHGFLIPLVTLYWLYKQRKKLLRLGIRKTLRRSGIGFSFLLLGMSLQIVGSFLRIYFLSGFALIFILLGGVDLLFGRRALRLCWFPIAFLATMVPLPLLVISEVTLRMKFFISEIATHLINATGIEAVRQGSYIYTRNAVLLVGDPCSGLRSFLAFLCLGLFFAYESKMELWKRIVLVAAGLPLALVSNVCRVYFLSMVGEIYGMQYTEGFVHDASGVAVFVIALVLFLVIQKKLESLRV
ncbi:exosortase/archaeosortase family protein [Omnitrophica bacterium]|nr:exosortase/archaeosortase family protein [Candidatus Omnitrophota bacterium]